MSKNKRLPANTEDCLYCPHYRGERRGCKLKKCTGGVEAHGKKPRKRGRSRWRG